MIIKMQYSKKEPKKRKGFEEMPHCSFWRKILQKKQTYKTYSFIFLHCQCLINTSSIFGTLTIIYVLETPDTLKEFTCVFGIP